MPAQLHVEALLHLSALVLIVSVAYLGLDKVHLEKDLFLEALKGSKTKAINFARQCDVMPGQAPAPESMFYRFPFLVKLKFYVICQIADVNGKINMGIFRPMHYCHRQMHGPLHGYFTNRRDRVWVSIFAAFSLLIFFYLTAAALWELKWFLADYFKFLHWVPNECLMTPIYWINVGFVVWIVLSVAVTHWLQNIDAITDSLQTDVDTHMKSIADDVARNALEKAKR